MISTHGRRHLTLAVGLCAAALLLISCDSQEPPAPSTSTGPTARAAADVCIVCKGKAGADAVAVTYKDAKLKCCGKECAENFNEEPGKYVPMSPPAGN